jgi:hypothetical protein
MDTSASLDLHDAAIGALRDGNRPRFDLVIRLRNLLADQEQAINGGELRAHLPEQMGRGGAREEPAEGAHDYRAV